MSRNTQNHDTDAELLKLIGRDAASMVGSNGSPKSAEKQKEAARIRRRDAAMIQNALDVLPASEWHREAPKPEPRPFLFPPYWRVGEVAVLTGRSGIGLSILATHLAELIARGQANSEQLTVNSADPRSQIDSSLFAVHSSLFAKARPQAVLYSDFNLTPTQFLERYSELVSRTRRVRYKFSKRHLRTYPGNLVKYLLGYGYTREQIFTAAIAHQASTGKYPVLIIDDLSHLCGLSASANEIRALLRRFRRWAAANNTSVLILANAGVDEYLHHIEFPSPYSTTRHLRIRPPRPSKRFQAILDESDSVFALCPSTMSSDLRYLKLLKGMDASTGTQPPSAALPPGSPPYERGVASRAIARDDGVVLTPALVNTYRITRTDSPPCLGGVANGRGGSSAESTHPHPFIGFEFLGQSPELNHHRDYTAEALRHTQATQRAYEKQQAKQLRSAKESLAQGILDGSYERYLLGP